MTSTMAWQPSGGDTTTLTQLDGPPAAHECAEEDITSMDQSPEPEGTAGGCAKLAPRRPTVQFGSAVETAVARVAHLPYLPARPLLHSSVSRPSIVDKLSQMNLSFAGCGFLGVYHIGVAACMRRFCPVLLKRKVSGASAGAIAAAALICDASLNVVMSDLVMVAREIQSHAGGPFSPFVSVPDMLRAGLERNLPDNAHVMCSGRLHISVTRLKDGKNCILSKFSSKEELIEALMCTAFIPAFSGWRPPQFGGLRYMDGCYSNNLPILDDRTITVSPFCGGADICPRDRTLSLIMLDAANTRVEMTPENLLRVFMIMYPPSPETLSDLANQGFNDAIRFLMRHDLMKCNMCVMTTEIVGRAYSSCGQLIQHQHCDDCSFKQQEAMLARLPAAVNEPLHQNILFSRRVFRNWILDFPGIRHVLILAVPWTIPYRIVKMLYRRLCAEIPKLASLVDGMTSEVVRAVHNGFSAHLPRSQRLHARYLCRINVTAYGESAGLEEGERPLDATEDATTLTLLPRFTPGFVRRYDREFQVAFTNRGTGTTTVRTTCDAERLESEVISVATSSECQPGIEVVDVDHTERPQVDAFDRDVVRLALEAQGQAECGVSWYYTDKDGNVRVRHVSAVPTPVATPCISRRQSVCDELSRRASVSDDLLTGGSLSRRASVCDDLDAKGQETSSGRGGSADETETEALREEEMTYEPGMSVIKEEVNDMLPED